MITDNDIEKRLAIVRQEIVALRFLRSDLTRTETHAAVWGTLSAVAAVMAIALGRQDLHEGVTTSWAPIAIGLLLCVATLACTGVYLNSRVISARRLRALRASERELAASLRPERRGISSHRQYLYQRYPLPVVALGVLSAVIWGLLLLSGRLPT